VNVPSGPENLSARKLAETLEEYLASAEVALLLHGLEFARVRHSASARSFASQEEITFGAGANETPLTPETEDLCRELCARLL